MTGDDTPLGRRSYLRGLGATAVAASLAGCGDYLPDRETDETTRETPEETPETTTDGAPESRTTDETTGETTEETVHEEADRFETVVNVADAGADASGEQPINGVLDEHLADDTMLYFPEGRYRLDQWEVTGYTNLGLVGDGAVLVPPEERYWLLFGELRDLLVEGFTFDGSADGVAPTNHLAVTGGESVVRDVTWRGHRSKPRTGFAVAAESEDADLLFENVSLPDGSTGGHAVFAFPRSVGRLTFRDCRVEHWAEGLYVSYHSGPLRVIGGYYANNGIQQVRVGGGHAGALVRGVTVRVDDPRQPQHKPNMRGIWMEEGGSVRVENCDIAVTDLSGTYSSGAIVVGKEFGAATIENTRIRTDADAYGILVRDPVEEVDEDSMPSMDRLPDDWEVTCRNVRITGSAPEGTAVRVDRRDDCVFENVCIGHDRGSRDGVAVSGAQGCAVRDSTIDVPGATIATDEATVKTSRVRERGGCEE
ncbi:right-handed parallel beta-helix repeat-containing protein [Halorussus salilacus]|uniref:right-handed parallel beta-helix repeat-containing protein n=1 Tax=Halorussus salilacus TaxID=2953750 RepID=UPI0020A0CEB7|nr:right-handed parallel beta-helix repeat-containing protein [Halorussus salilacus]USZ68086.1 right-handed parallel beta-helix repeat-containing protein [Halorussus salilacus]